MLTLRLEKSMFFSWRSRNASIASPTLDPPTSTFVPPDLTPALPEIFMLLAVCAVLLVDVILPGRTRTLTFQLAQGTIVVAALLALAGYPETAEVTFAGSYVNDAMGTVLKVFVLLVGYFGVFYMRAYLVERDRLRGDAVCG